MTPTRRVALPAGLLGIVALLSIICGCHRRVTKSPAHSLREHDCLPPMVLRTQDDKPLNLAALKGRPSLVDFIYSSCTGPCMLSTIRMAKLVKALHSDPAVNFISITVDPGHDTPQRLASYARAMGIEGAGWRLLTGDPRTIGEVLALFDMHPRQMPDGSFEQSIGLYLLDRQGRPVVRFDPVEVRTQVIVRAVKEMLGESASERPPGANQASR